MSARWPALPDNNYRKLKRVADKTDQELYIEYGILPRELTAARQYIARRVTEMKKGNEMFNAKKLMEG